MRITLSILAVLSVMSVGVLGNFYQATMPRVGTTVVSTQMENQIGGNAITFKIPDNLTEKQYNLLNLAYDMGKSAGLTDPKLVQGILFQESRAGAIGSYKVAGHELGLKANERYYGVGQIKLQTAKHVLGKFSQLYEKYDFHTRTDEEIIANLIMNDEFNLDIASRYLKIISAEYCKDPSCIIASYNKGPTGAKELQNPSALDYVQKVKQHIKNLR